jgi:hypothetical protein
MGIRTLLRYLIGDRQAILEIAADRRAFWVGLLFVLSAGFAREYDGEDLWHEPWHLLIPLAASLVSSFVLFTICFVRLVKTDPQRPAFFAAYRSFLTLFWMTAPLAWLYAVPYERFLGAADAVRANLLTLAVVAVWRVALMVRVVQVLMGYRVLSAVLLVLAFADLVAFLAALLTPRPVFAIMGGVRLTESEILIRSVTHNLMCLGGCSFPIWLFAAIAQVGSDKPAWRLAAETAPVAVVPSRGLLALAFTSLVVWVFILPTTQAEQRLRHTAERDLREGRIAEAVTFMSAHAAMDFPPHWEPPPRMGYGETNPPLLDILEAIVERPTAPWVELAYLEKVWPFVGNYGVHYLSTTEVSRLVRLLSRWPLASSQVMNPHRRDDFAEFLHRDGLSAEDKATLRSLLRLDEKGKPIQGGDTRQ